MSKGLSKFDAKGVRLVIGTFSPRAVLEVRPDLVAVIGSDPGSGIGNIGERRWTDSMEYGGFSIFRGAEYIIVPEGPCLGGPHLRAD